ncbi:MAG: proteasome accessory factor PafA2 family protein [Candidatus Omnitrophica bacterium]|nr:proteasome accessory factor PafA2 family protein [Candidatus Omnitrophota bacterium]
MSKLNGADIELGNYVQGLHINQPTGKMASRLLLKVIQGIERPPDYMTRHISTYPSAKNILAGGNCVIYSHEAALKESDHSQVSQDMGRKFLPANGGCFYIDLDHLELCLPECLSAFDHAACWNAMLRIVRNAMDRVNEQMPRGQKVVVLVNNSDGQSNAYGSHLNFLIGRKTFHNLFEHKLHLLLALASHQISSIVYTGQGKVGSENRRPGVDYQISQRADFFETIQGMQTTFKRPIVNTRDEALAGRMNHQYSDAMHEGMARFHSIFFDNTLCHGSSLLKIGVMQIFLSMIEKEMIPSGWIFENPLSALLQFSHDPSLETRAKLVDGQSVTAVEHQMMILESAKRFVDQGYCNDAVPHVHRILELWEDTLNKLERRNFSSLTGRIDYLLKSAIIYRAFQQDSSLQWNSPAVKRLDLTYSDLDSSRGLYWIYERAGLTEQLVSEDDIQRFIHNPPENTRAWTRAMLLRSVSSKEIDDVDWDWISFKKTTNKYWRMTERIELDNPLGYTRADTEPIFQTSQSLQELVDKFQTLQSDLTTNEYDCSKSTKK